MFQTQVVEKERWNAHLSQVQVFCKSYRFQGCSVFFLWPILIKFYVGGLCTNLLQVMFVILDLVLAPKLTGGRLAEALEQYKFSATLTHNQVHFTWGHKCFFFSCITSVVSLLNCKACCFTVSGMQCISMAWHCGWQKYPHYSACALGSRCFLNLIIF